MAVPDEAHPAAKPKYAWSKQEDALLRAQVRGHGARNWETISAALPGRTGKSCRLRWCQHLAPDVDAARTFTHQEDAKILALQKVHPNKWATIAEYLPGRTDNAVKNRWNSVLRKQQDRTITLFRLVPGDVGTARSVIGPVIDYIPSAEGDGGAAGDDYSNGSCLNLFPLAAGDLVGSNAAPTDGDFGADDPITKLRLSFFPSKAAAATEFRAVAMVVRDA